MCLIVGSGLDLDAGNEKVLLARLALMHIMVLGISFITRFERIRWQTSVARERELRRERIELSQTIHDTIAQTAYMIGLGIHRARELADESNEEQVAALDATSALSRSAMWEVRGPIDAGLLLEGRQLGRVLLSHCATFERITGVPAGISQSGSTPYFCSVAAKSQYRTRWPNSPEVKYLSFVTSSTPPDSCTSQSPSSNCLRVTGSRWDNCFRYSSTSRPGLSVIRPGRYTTRCPSAPLT